MAIVLLCSRCPNTLGLYHETEKPDVEAAASRNGWTEFGAAWICPQHNLEAMLRADYEVAVTEFEAATHQFHGASAERADLPASDGGYQLERAFQRQKFAYSKIQAARKQLADFFAGRKRNKPSPQS